MLGWSNPFMRKGSLFNHPDYYVKSLLPLAITQIIFPLILNCTNLWYYIALLVAVVWTSIIGLIRRYNRSLTPKQTAHIELVGIIGANTLTLLAIILAFIA